MLRYLMWHILLYMTFPTFSLSLVFTFMSAEEAILLLLGGWLQVHLYSSSRNRDLNLSVLLIDIDHLKKINDGYRHLMGDRVLFLSRLFSKRR